MKKVKYLVLFFILASCNAPRAVYDYDQDVNFQKIKTYKIYPDLASKMSQLDEQRLLDIIHSELRTKGLVTAENPDIYVNFYASTYETTSNNNLGIGVGGGGGNMGVGISGGIPLGGPQTILDITFDFIDAKKDLLIWQAKVESKFNMNASPE
ncbi:MAG: DUF4136 domain-containing protein, partial [Gillisia sp.]